MSDVLFAVLISTSGTVLVAAFAACGVIFGPAWKERVAADSARIKEEAALERAATERRFDRAGEFLESLGPLAPNYDSRSSKKVAARAARTRFVSTLRQGENSVADFTRGLLRALEKDSEPSEFRAEYLEEGSDLLMKFLRGEMKEDELTPFVVYGPLDSPLVMEAPSWTG